LGENRNRMTYPKDPQGHEMASEISFLDEGEESRLPETEADCEATLFAAKVISSAEGEIVIPTKTVTSIRSLAYAELNRTNQLPPSNESHPTVRCIVHGSASSLSDGPKGDVVSQPSATMFEKDRFLDEGEIARGGMGTIHRVFDNRLLRYEAMKRLDAGAEQEPTLVSHFVEEAQITGQLDHPNIVPVYNLRQRDDESPYFFTMKLVKGRDFGKLMDELGHHRLKGRNLEYLLQVFIKVCDAVAFAHSRGVLHCDLKPDNVMVGDHGQVYLMDWGLAMTEAERAYRQQLKRDPTSLQGGPLHEHHDSVMVRGTPAYMAPEQAWGRLHEFDERTDIFGLGGILYRMLTLASPRAGRTLGEAVRKARYEVITPPEQLIPDLVLPPELCRITMKALHHEQHKRYACVDDFKEDIHQFLRGGGWFSTKTFQADDIIIREGDSAGAAYVIVEGQCQAYKEMGDERIPLRTMGPGEVFGETGVFTSKPRTASVVALTEVTLKVVTRSALEEELLRNEWMGKFVRALAERFRERDEQFTQLLEPPSKN
jgi:eukaryotic-like serine/threonine-protein kinase